jgi:hypothetical protein
MMTIQLTYQSTPSQILLLTSDPVTIYAYTVLFALVEYIMYWVGLFLLLCNISCSDNTLSPDAIVCLDAYFTQKGIKENKTLHILT